MKSFCTALGILLLLSSCTPSESVDTGQGQAESCPQLAASPISLKPDAQEPLYAPFDFHIQAIAEDEQYLRFRGEKVEFVVCKVDRTWSVVAAPSEDKPVGEAAHDARLAEIENPSLKSITLNDKTYQYRVKLNASWINSEGSPTPSPELTRAEEGVVFELITPESPTPREIPLYTRRELEEAQLGASLGVPRVSAAIATEDSLWWAIAAEQGEGASGIATLIRFTPSSGDLEVIKPEGLQGVQMTDLAVTGSGESFTLWIGTQISGEGNPYLPAMGLVRYRPQENNLNTGDIATYTPQNSPLIGTIPDRLLVQGETLWIATANGVCAVPHGQIDQATTWECWRFTATADLPASGVPLYPSVQATQAATTLTGDRVEVLWIAPAKEAGENQPFVGRYEVKYDPGFTLSLAEGATQVPNELSRRFPLVQAAPPVAWPGDEWRWEGDRFVRALDEVNLNMVGGGPSGIGTEGRESPNPYLQDWAAIRGDLSLLELTNQKTEVRYYSGWVDADLLDPTPTVVPAEEPTQRQPNPLEAIAQPSPES